MSAEDFIQLVLATPTLPRLRSRGIRTHLAPLGGAPETYRLPRRPWQTASLFPWSTRGANPSKFLLKLYVAGKTLRAEQAIANLRKICSEDLEDRYELEIIDVIESPEKAEADKILATPTLIKQLPPPLRRVIGDLSDKEKVLLGLEVLPALDPPNPPDPAR